MLYVYNLLAAMYARVENAKDRGATATEYAMLVAFIAVAITLAVVAFGTQLHDFFNTLATKIGLSKAPL